MGTRYVRDTPIPSYIALEVGETMTLPIEHIYAEIPIANDLAINMR